MSFDLMITEFPVPEISSDPAVRPLSLVLMSWGETPPPGGTDDAGVVARLSKPIQQSQLHDCLIRIAATGSNPMPAPPARTVEPLPPAPAGGARVLLAEDNETNQIVATGVLQERAPGSRPGSASLDPGPGIASNCHSWRGRPVYRCAGSIAAGAVDGQDAFQGYPFIGSGSTGFPDASAVLRSYFGHDALEVRFAAEHIDHDELETYPDAVGEVDEMATKHAIEVNDARDGVLLYRGGSDQEADLIVTEREWLLAERHRPHGQLLANVVSPDEALAIIGLYLRWHQLPVIIGGASTRWHPTSMRRSAAYTAMPAFERWNQAGRVWFDTKNDLTLDNLNRTLLTRVSRAFQFRDSIFALSRNALNIRALGVRRGRRAWSGCRRLRTGRAES